MSSESSYLLNLPMPLWGEVWPEERVVLGMRTSKSLHTHLQKCEVALIRGSETLGRIDAETVSADLSRLREGKICIDWGVDLCGKLLRAIAKSRCAPGLHKLLIRSYLTTEHGHQLVPILRECTQLQRLCLRSTAPHTGLGAGGTQSLVEGLIACTALAVLALPGNGIVNAGARALAGVLGGFKTLIELDVSENNIGPDGVGAVAAALTVCASLEALNLSRNELGPEGAGRLAEGLMQCKEQMTHLNLSWSNLGAAGVQNLAPALGACPRLKILDLSHNSMEAEGMEALAQGLEGSSQLESLELAGNELGADGAGVLGGVLLGADCSASTQTFATTPPASNAEATGGLALLPRAQVRLRTLDLAQNRIDAEGVARLGAGLGGGGRLSRLRLSLCSLLAEGAASLARVLPGCAQLAHLELCHAELGPAGAALLGPALGQCSRLRELVFTDNELEDAGAGGLAAGLARMRGLERLDLSGNGLEPAGVGRVAGALVESGAPISHLSLARNVVGGGAAAEEVGRAVGMRVRRGELRELDLSECYLAAQGVRVLAAALFGEGGQDVGEGAGGVGGGRRGGYGLRSLLLDSNVMGAEGAAALVEAMQGVGQNCGGGEGISGQGLVEGDRGTGARCGEGAAKIARGAETLEELRVADNHLGDAGARVIASLVTAGAEFGGGQTVSGGSAKIRLAFLGLSHNEVSEELAGRVKAEGGAGGCVVRTGWEAESEGGEGSDAEWA